MTTKLKKLRSKPVHSYFFNDDKVILKEDQFCKGQTMFQFYAGLALVGLLSSPNRGNASCRKLAESAFEVASAMVLLEREMEDER